MAVFPVYHTLFGTVRQGKKCGSFRCRNILLLTEGLAVGALIHSGVGFVSAYQNAIQRTKVLALAVVCALLDGALNALVGMIVHTKYLLLSKLGVSMCRKKRR